MDLGHVTACDGMKMTAEGKGGLLLAAVWGAEQHTWSEKANSALFYTWENETSLLALFMFFSLQKIKVHQILAVQ